MFAGDYWLPLTVRRYWPWYLRSEVAGVILANLTAPGPRATLGPQQTVEIQKTQVCVHTRLIDEVWEWKIQHSLQLVREMGADTIVEFFPWAYIENTQDRYDWESADRIVRHAQNQGLQIIARMGYVPLWARPNVEDQFSTLNYLPEDSFDDFADFVVDFATRYAGVIDQIIIWNEPNLAFEWGYRPVDPQGYVNLLQAVYEPVHQANPNVIILAAALAPTLEPEGSPNGLNDLLYLDAILKAGAADYFDALAIHTYGFTESPQEQPEPDVLNFRRAELLHNILHNYTDKPVYITETGWNDHPRWTKAVRPAQRIQYTLEALEWAEQEWPWAEKLCLWAFRYPAPTLSYPDNFTFITPEFQIKPIYYAVQDYARGWSRSENLWLDAPED